LQSPHRNAHRQAPRRTPPRRFHGSSPAHPRTSSHFSISTFGFIHQTHRLISRIRPHKTSPRRSTLRRPHHFRSRIIRRSIIFTSHPSPSISLSANLALFPNDAAPAGTTIP